MGKFLELEAGYLFIGFVILAVTLFVSTRHFFADGSYKKALISVGMFLAVAIGLHFNITTNRMAEVKAAFSEGKIVICESREMRKGARSVNVEKSRDWVLEGDLFTSPNYSRPFHTARCILPIKKLKN